MRRVWNTTVRLWVSYGGMESGYREIDRYACRVCIGFKISPFLVIHLGRKLINLTHLVCLVSVWVRSLHKYTKSYRIRIKCQITLQSVFNHFLLIFIVYLLLITINSWFLPVLTTRPLLLLCSCCYWDVDMLIIKRRGDKWCWWCSHRLSGVR